jgi:RND family efflux transporter MFP subunit
MFTFNSFFNAQGTTTTAMTIAKENTVELTPSEQHVVSTKGRTITSQRGAAGPAFVKLGVFVVVATLIAVGGYFGAQEFLLDDDASSDTRRPVAVERGTLLDDVTATGSVSFPELESLRFDISGTVAELLVDEGDSVTRGQQLILLDDVTISGLESAVVSAELALQQAGEDLAELLSGATTLENAIAESNVADARVASMNAATDLAEFTSSGGADSPATAEAKAALADANDEVADAITAANEVADAQAELVADAQEVYDDAEAGYQDQIIGWFGNVVAENDLQLSPAVLLAQWDTSVDQIILDAKATVNSPQDDLSTPWNESVVWVWTHLTPYPILTGCDSTSDAFTFRCPSAEIDESWDAVVAAQESLVEVIDTAADEAAAQQLLIDAEQELVEAAAEDIVETVNDIEISALAATLAEKIALETDAEETLASLSDLDILQIKSATADVNQKNAQLENAKIDLAAANLVAPFDGVITSISVDVGDPVNRTTTTMDILDPSVVILDGSIDEIDVLSLRVGDAVSVTLDALPDQPLLGVIDEIGDGVNQQGVIEFPLTVALTPPEGIDLIEGLSATATIILNQIDNALLIPLQAIGGSFSEPSVDVVNGESFVTTPITLGASDDFWVVVESGLSEGQEVLMEIAESVDPLQQLFGGAGGGAIRIPGGFTGGRGGGGGGGGR